MKEDAPTPDAIPRKRSQIKSVPDLWIATWLARDDIAPSDRRRLEAEKADRRKRTPDRVVGLVIGEEGMTPEQFNVFRELIESSGATAIHHPGVASRVHMLCKHTAPVTVHYDSRSPYLRNTEVIRAADTVIAVPKGPDGGRNDGLWDRIRYAKHRRLPIKIIMPDGVIQ